jgi:hypothetical protein
VLQEDISNKDHVETDLVALIRAYAPFLSFLALAYGIINQWVYYHGFNINILEFTDLNELLLSALSSFLALTIYTMLIGLYYWFSTRKIIKHGDPRRTVMQFVLFMTYGFTVIPIIYYCLFDDMWNIYSKLSLAIFSLITVILIVLIRKFDQYYTVIFNNSPNSRILNLAVISLMVLNFSICTAIFQIGKVKHQPDTGTGIMISKKTIISTKYYFQIGRCNNYTFFYDIKADRTDIFPNKDITQIVIMPD